MTGLFPTVSSTSRLRHIRGRGLLDLLVWLAHSGSARSDPQRRPRRPTADKFPRLGYQVRLYWTEASRALNGLDA